MPLFPKKTPGQTNVPTTTENKKAHPVANKQAVEAFRKRQQQNNPPPSQPIKKTYPKQYPTKHPKSSETEDSVLFGPSTNSLNTYLGQKGYTLLKSELGQERTAALKTRLTARPVTNGISYGPASEATTYPVFRESDKKIYIPRFYGESVFGPPKQHKLPDPVSIDVPFAGSLKPMQIPVVDAYLAAVSSVLKSGGGGLLELPCAFGKTVLSLNIISRLSTKTLVIVNKEFLMTQWIERIKQFLPSARVGRIQGPDIDIEDKDIVIGMLQSISMKDYPESVFASFGLTIIDEVHHISSEVFSRALFKIVTKYMLGLSATMERKDGTTYLFKMFLGEVVFKGDRDEEHAVEVRAIQYSTRDAAFNETEYDWRGNAKYSTMISKISAYNDRSEFIVRILRDLVIEQPGSQIMVLAHNRSLLTYLGEALDYRKFATWGFYVGGMREEALKATEEKQVVLATYAMAAEALDIKTLSSLVMVTPKTDIVQSVGRILRTKHEKPIVVDLVDAHEVFQKQWIQRRRFYKKCEYTIKQVNSTDYDGFLHMDTSWRTVFQGKRASVDDSDGDTPNPNGNCMVKLDDDIV
jgi:superfamily II DNA or RNA helicase